MEGAVPCAASYAPPCCWRPPPLSPPPRRTRRRRRSRPSARRSRSVWRSTPPAYFLRGFSVHAEVKPAALPHWGFGLGLFTLEMPAFMLGSNTADALVKLGEPRVGDKVVALPPLSPLLALHIGYEI